MFALSIVMLVLVGCTTTGIDRGSTSSPESLTEKDSRFILNRPLADFYDGVFVFTDAGRSPPHVIGLDAMADRLVEYDVIFYGESHRHPGVHLQQQRLLRELHARFPGLILSMEHFERDVQPVINDYLAGRIGENTLVDKGRAWDNYRPSYRPMVQFARDHKLPVIAAEAPVWTIACIGQWGPEILEQFSPEERGYVAKDLHITPGAYRDKYMKFQSGSSSHGGGANPSPQAQLRAERSFAAQIARDDSMAESIFLAMQQSPGKKVLHLNGVFHSAGFLGTVEKLRLRNPSLKIAVIGTLEVDDARSPSFSRNNATEGTVLQLVYTNPAPFAEGEDQREWVRKIMAKREANPCKYSPKAAESAK
jgi:uncharacterized iron-regulated protein